LCFLCSTFRLFLLADLKCILAQLAKSEKLKNFTTTEKIDY
jgi:hypothetical protein